MIAFMKKVILKKLGYHDQGKKSDNKEDEQTKSLKFDIGSIYCSLSFHLRLYILSFAEIMVEYNKLYPIDSRFYKEIFGYFSNDPFRKAFCISNTYKIEQYPLGMFENCELVFPIKNINTIYFVFINKKIDIQKIPIFFKNEKNSYMIENLYLSTKINFYDCFQMFEELIEKGMVKNLHFHGNSYCDLDYNKLNKIEGISLIGIKDICIKKLNLIFGLQKIKKIKIEFFWDLDFKNLELPLKSTNLKELKIKRCEKFSDSELKRIIVLFKKLKIINVKRTSISIKGFLFALKYSQIKKITSDFDLNMEDVQSSFLGEEISKIESNNYLEYFDNHNLFKNSKILKILKKCKKLKVLKLNEGLSILNGSRGFLKTQNEENEDFFNILSTFHNLKRLRCGVTENDLKNISKLNNIEDLELSIQSIQQVSNLRDALKGMKSLKYLTLRAIPFTLDKLQFLKVMKLKELNFRFPFEFDIKKDVIMFLEDCNESLIQSYYFKTWRKKDGYFYWRRK